MTYNFQECLDHFDRQLASLQAGRVNPGLIEAIPVEAYGTVSPLQQLSAITNQGAQTLIVQPWDHSIIKDIERALRTKGTDLNPIIDGTIIRLNFPPLTEDKRKSLAKLVHEQASEAHVAIKRQREEYMQKLKQQKNDGALSEDMWFAEQKKLQSVVDASNKTIDERASTKIDSLMTM